MAIKKKNAGKKWEQNSWKKIMAPYKNHSGENKLNQTV